MKMQSHTLLNELSKTEMQKLTSQVEETLARDIEVNKVKIFSSADLWNIQRRRRGIVIR